MRPAVVMIDGWVIFRRVHNLSLISTVAAAFTVAWVLGLLTQRLRLSPIVGYILAGVIIGPYTPGFSGDLEAAQQLAEVGVVLLMFGVGLHFHPRDLLAVKGVAIPGAVGQSLVATLVAMWFFSFFDIPLKTGAVIGMAIAVASTVVLMRVLLDSNVLDSPQGHVAVGWLIVEDIFTVVLLVLIPALGSTGGEGGIESAGALSKALAVALTKLAALATVVLVVGGRVIPWVMVRVARLRSRELFTLTVLVFSIAIAAGSYFFFGASMALGAFLAGLVVAQSPVSHQAAADALPMRDAFAVMFFVSVGMLFDPAFLIKEPVMIATALVIILVVKPLTALAIVAILGHSARTALTVAIGLAQIGEFSFILSELARQHGLMTDMGHNVLVGSALISMTLNPMSFRALPQIEAWLRQRPVLWKLLTARAERRAAATNRAAAQSVSKTAETQVRLAIVVGYGPVGRSVHRLLREAKITTVVIDMNMDTVSALISEGQAAIFGDAARETILEQAGVQRASYLLLTLPGSGDRAAIVTAVRNLNPSARILVRARYLREREELEQAGATAAVFEEAEAAVGLARLVLADTGLHREAADRKIKDIRLQLIMENVSNIRTQRVRSVMVPWARVRSLSSSADRSSVLGQVAQERFSRWPVVDPNTRRSVGYLLTKDLVANAAESDWSRLIRPLGAISPDDSIESALTRMQGEGATVYLVEDKERPVGLITLEDILEQVVGQIEDEYPHETVVSLQDAVANGSIVLGVMARSRDQVIRELFDAIPAGSLPPGPDREKLIENMLAREAEVSTDLGNGVAIPHARYPELAAPIVVIGQSAEGLIYSPTAPELVRLIFLLIAPSEQPEVHLALLGQIARICSDPAAREKLNQAASTENMMDVLSGLASKTSD